MTFNKNDFLRREPLSSGGGSTPSGVESIVAGDNIAVDNTDPANPIISSTGGGGTGPSSEYEMMFIGHEPVLSLSGDAIYGRGI